MTKNIYDVSVRNYQAHFSRTNLFTELTNQSEQALSNTLFLIATVFLGLASPFSSNLKELSEGPKVLLLISWISAIISIFFGFLQFFFNLRFFEKKLNLSNEQEILWADMPNEEEENKYINLLRKSNEKAEMDSTKTTSIPLLFQAIFIILAIILSSFASGWGLFRKDDYKYTYEENKILFSTTKGICRERFQ